jgi:hypothetical protein
VLLRLPPVLLCLQWREAECLVLRPHSFDALKQLPELRQIISHTAVSAIKEASAEGLETLAYFLPTEPDEGSTHDKEHHLLSPVTPVLEHLAPGLRLVLAAEVAVGMLCPG